MKKLLLLGIITLTALFTACEKDKDEPKDETAGGGATSSVNISSLDTSDSNYYYWKVSVVDEDGTHYYTCLVCTNSQIIETIQYSYGHISLISKISEEECYSMLQ